MSQAAHSGLDRLAAHASAEAVSLARTVLEQDVSDAQWAAQIGPALTQGDAARLLNKTEQAVSKDPRLLRLRNRDGRPVYPVVQFDGRGQLAGVAEVLNALCGPLEPLTAASWLTSGNPELGGLAPAQALRGGELAAVTSAAARLAASAAG
jgi:hypothetical protein